MQAENKNCMKTKKTSLWLLAAMLTIHTTGQIYFTRNGQISFFSKAPLENITAYNNEVTSFLDAQKREFAFVVLIKSFKFRKALMEEHFNENYMESNTFPKANFKGNILDGGNIDFSKDGIYHVTVKGDLTIHGVTKNLEAPGTITISNGLINAVSNFKLQVKDFNIKIPSTVINNIAETVDVSVSCKYDSFKRS